METYFVLMIFGGVFFVIFSLVVIINFGFMAKKVSNFGHKGFGSGMVTHALFGFFAFLGGVTFVGGVVWFLIEKFATTG